MHINAAFLGNAGKKGKGKKGKASSSVPAPQDQKLNHSLDMIDAFSKLKVFIQGYPIPFALPKAGYTVAFA